MADERLRRVVCIANGKGGVLKSSIAANVAGLTAAAGYRVLLVDLDPQGDVSDDLGYFDDSRDDAGQALVDALLTGGPAKPTITQVRPNLDVVTGGERLADITAVIVARANRGEPTTALLAQSLAPTAASYDLILIDTPPVDVTLQTLALRAARWLLIPTKADASSIRGIARIAQRVAYARQDGHELDILGVILTGTPASATRVRSGAAEDIESILGGVAPFFPTAIRSSDAVAREARSRGVLVHELAELVEGAEPFWQSLREGRAPQRAPGSAPALADEYVRLTEYTLQRIDELETQSKP